MSNEKPVELTESEKADLIDAFQDGYLMSTDPMTSDLTQLGIVVTRIKAAARREALLEAAEESEMRINLANRVTSLEAKVARVEALAASASWVPLRTDRTEVTRHVRMVKAADITAALAEPERDEEGGR